MVLSSTNLLPYVCSGCEANGVKLWRQYQTFLSNIDLLCVDCAGANQKKDVSAADDGGYIQSEYGRSNQIGWLVPAVPTAENDTYWGYTSVPEDRVAWWRGLPTRLGNAKDG